MLSYYVSPPLVPQWDPHALYALPSLANTFTPLSPYQAPIYPIPGTAHVQHWHPSQPAQYFQNYLMPTAPYLTPLPSQVSLAPSTSPPLVNSTPSISFHQFQPRFLNSSEFTQALNDLKRCAKAKGFSLTHKQLLAVIPESQQFKALQDLAEWSKKEGLFDISKRFLASQIHASPSSSAHNWAEYAKLYDDQGDMERAEAVLHLALRYFPLDDTLLTRALRMAEKSGKPQRMRKIMALTAGENTEKSKKMMLEAAWIEARFGNISLANKIAKHLLHSAPSASLYLDACVLAERELNLEKALALSTRALSQYGNYGPLWLVRLRLLEKTGRLSKIRSAREEEEALTDVRALERMESLAHEGREGSQCASSSSSSSVILAGSCVSAATSSNTHIPSEYKWKLFLELAQAEERFGQQCEEDYSIGRRESESKRLTGMALARARSLYVESVKFCPQHLRWRVWLAGARTEVTLSPELKFSTARSLLSRAFAEAPTKRRSVVLTEWARCAEFADQRDEAREKLKEAKKQCAEEWLVYMESALFAMRCDGREAAIQECMEGLRLHAGSGRLWALLIYLTCSYCNVYTPLSTLPSLSDPSSSPPPPPPPSSSPSLSFSVDNQASTPSPAHPLPSCSSSPPSPSPTQVKNLFRLAMREVPKSGEVWCEIARTLINKRNFTEARKALDFALHFTPQCGDTFLEWMRLEMTMLGTIADWDTLLQLSESSEPTYGSLWLQYKRNSLESPSDTLTYAYQHLSLALSEGDNSVADYKPSSHKSRRWQEIFGGIKI